MESLVLAVAGDLQCIWGYPKIAYEQAPWRQVRHPTLSCPTSPRGTAGELEVGSPTGPWTRQCESAFCRAAATRRPFAARRPPSRRFALPLSDRRRLPSADRSNCRWKPAVGPLNFASWEIYIEVATTEVITVDCIYMFVHCVSTKSYIHCWKLACRDL